MCHDAWKILLFAFTPFGSSTIILLAVWTDFYNIFTWMRQSTNSISFSRKDHPGKGSWAWTFAWPWVVHQDIKPANVLVSNQHYSTVLKTILGDFPSFRLLRFRRIFRHFTVLHFHLLGFRDFSIILSFKDFRGFSIISPFMILGDFPPSRLLGLWGILHHFAIPSFRIWSHFLPVTISQLSVSANQL